MSVNGKIVAVVPTCRGFKIPEQTVDVEWIIVHDGERRDVEGDAKHIVAPDIGMFGAKCDSIRSAGFLAALEDGARYILTVDDDCSIPLDWAEDHAYNLSRRLSPWWQTVDGIETRGVPTSPVDVEPVAITHGVWDGVLDLSAVDQMRTGGAPHRIKDAVFRRIGAPFPQSAMNFGFRAEVAAAIYQPAQGQDSPFDRFADIWGGLLAQRVLSLHGYAFMNGGAVVYHSRKSDPQVNFKKEAPGAECHVAFWRHVWEFCGADTTVEGTYLALADHVETFEPKRMSWRNYFSRVARNMRTWVDSTARASQSSSLSTKTA